MSISMCLAILMLALTQSIDPKPPILIGSDAAKYSAQDIAEMEKLVGGKAWLIDAYEAVGGGYADLYLPPTTATKELRRGTVVMVSIVKGGKRVYRTSSYAQVSIEGRATDELRSAGDANRPFRIQDGASFDDAELVSIVRFIRTKPISPVTNLGRPGPVNGDLPIKVVNRITQTGRYKAGQIMVVLWLDDGNGVDVVLEKMGDAWIVISAIGWVD